MIRKSTFAMTPETFAAERREILNRTDGDLEAPVAAGVKRVGLPGWQNGIVAAALEVFDRTARAEVDQWNPIIDDLRAVFEQELRETLRKTKPSKNPEAQAASLVRWISTMSVNAATEAATTSDIETEVGLQWVTMGDADVRHSHQEANGQIVPSGQPFEVSGEELLYPGQPVGNPALWYNCRCVALPTMLSEYSASTLTASSDGPWTTATIMALPAKSDPINDISSEEDAHVTLLFLGEAADFDPTAILDVMKAVAAGASSAVTETVNGFAVIGEHKADVALIEADSLANIRGAILATPDVRAVHDSVEQFPAWIPHLTLGYPESPRNEGTVPSSVTFDRIALWYGEEKTEFTLSENPTETIVAAAEVEADLVVEESAQEPDGVLDPADFDAVPWYGVLAPEGVLSGDGRMFEDGSLTNRELPLPLKYMPIDDDGHKGSMVVARIDRIWREDGLIKAEGVFDTSAMAYEAIRQIANGMFRGVSVDIDSAVASAGKNGRGASVSSGSICSATLCAIPAFAEAWVAIGTWADVSRETEPVVADNAPTELVTEAHTLELSGNTGTFKLSDVGEFASVPTKTKDGPGWITNPGDTKRITDYWVDGVGAAKIGWGAPGDFNRCRANLAKYVQNPDWLSGLCANLHYRALRTWPGAAHVAVAEGLVASASMVMAEDDVLVSADLFRDPMLDKPTPLTITDKGHVFGHLATWGTCHIGVGSECVVAPQSKTNYAYFLTGEVPTDAGRVAVGQISLGGGHATERAGVRAAASHYDSTSAAVADITVGEDDFGIWVAGSVRDDVDPKTVRKLMSAALSGDWRRVVVNGVGNLELVAALAVNVPGFPIPRSSYASTSAGQMSLIAAGIVYRDEFTVVSEPRKTRDLSDSRDIMRMAKIASSRNRVTN